MGTLICEDKQKDIQLKAMKLDLHSSKIRS